MSFYVDVEPEFLIALYLATYLSRAKAGATLSTGLESSRDKWSAKQLAAVLTDTWTVGQVVLVCSCVSGLPLRQGRD